jgi:hypothetical protein
MNAQRKRAAATRLAELEGLLGVASVDLDHGSVEIALDRGASFDLELAALLDGEVLELARAAAKRIGPESTLDSIVISAGPLLHVLVPSRRAARKFLYLLVERDRVALGLLLHYLGAPEGNESMDAEAPGSPALAAAQAGEVSALGQRKA